MFTHTRRTISLRAALVAFALCLPVVSAPAQTDDKEPAYREYKGVRIGMTADEARKKLGEPTDKDDKQDFYSFNDNESAQVFYDSDKKVYAVSVIYLGGGSVPTAKTVFGSDIEANPDGSVHGRIDYPKAGYWVAYSRTSGSSPLTTVTMQKRQQTAPQ